MVLTSDQQSEIEKYVSAYAAAMPVDAYYAATVSEQRQYKNDAERAAADAAPLAQLWYDTLRKAMSEHRIGRYPDWQKVLANQDAQLGQAVQQRVGAFFRQMNRNHNAINGNGQNGHTINGECAMLPDAATILSRQEIPLTDAKQRYRALAETYTLLPPDSVVALLWGFSRQKVNRIRGELEAQGYEFASAELPEWAYREREKWWQVVKRPLTEPEIKAQLAAKLSDKIQALSSGELKTLLELLA